MSFTRDGYLIVPGLLTEPDCDALADAVKPEAPAGTTASPNRRSLLRDVPPVAGLARSPRLLELIRQHTGREAFPVRAQLFDKTPDVNWAVSWHQDLAIAVRERRDAPGFSGWSIKDGIPHVHPPAEVLKEMVAIRLHLDDCDRENGALLVLPGSHLEGKLDEAPMARWKERVTPVTCEVPRGGALLLRPLLLHASARATRDGHRRVIHIEYATASLPDGLAWDSHAA